jgi:hypothetical protein
MSCLGRVLSLSLEFELFSAFSLVCLFLCHLLVLWFLLLLDDLLKLFFDFCSSSYALCVLDLLHALDLFCASVFLFFGLGQPLCRLLFYLSFCRR